ncbi:ABC transporter substrate-binding protein [Caballeronia mineralivorans]|jgi:polar amino acid transport system substrate-binding protein|uniref:ABC transporter substrate-binding protein n=2 Tax=Caballeronia mineralivorans TaxID=2010198 RepID=UPI0023F2C4A0|nr:ABC transporter substrate-binding protein [Caballeronia mineralivorans]MDB5788299.1 transporter substrate-binding protein [Caballeronia mineralivorans]MEA3104715.1 polar amino acid transport system substrate-binding protein [Caballeronia mineralivorans]
MQPYRPSFSPRRALIAGVTGLMLLVLQTAANAATQAPPTIAAGTLTIGSDLTYPPYAFMDGETPAGLDPDFMKTLASHLQLKPLFVDTRFANLILGVNAKRIDVIASALYVTPERAKQIDFVPYFKTGGSLLALTGSGFKPATPEALCGKRVSSIKGASWIPKLAKISQDTCVPKGLAPIDVREFETSPQASQALLAHAVDAQFEDSAVAKMTVDKMAGRLAITSTTPLFPVVVGLGVAKSDPALLAAVKGALDTMKHDGEYATLLKRYNVAEPTSAEIAQALGAAN